MDILDITWRARFGNFGKALSQLDEATQLRQQRPLSALENLGLIHTFEFTDEQAWQALRDFLAYQGIADVIGSRDTLRQAFKRQLITDSEGWMMMLTDTNRSLHADNQETADDIAGHIHGRYVDVLHQLSATLEPHLADE